MRFIFLRIFCLGYSHAPSTSLDPLLCILHPLSTPSMSPTFTFHFPLDLSNHIHPPPRYHSTWSLQHKLPSIWPQVKPPLASPQAGPYYWNSLNLGRYSTSKIMPTIKCKPPMPCDIHMFRFI